MIERDLTDPTAFRAQPPAPNPRVAEYMEQASALSRDVIRRWTPRRCAYGPDTSHRLDVFSASKRGGLRPGLIFFHGGAWTTGYLWWSSFMAPGVREAGGVLVAPTYRLGPEYRFPAQLEDVAAAIAWTWRNAEEMGVDRDRLVVGGHSAGGHLAALAALHPDALPNAGAARDVVKACFPVSSAFNLHYPGALPGSGEERVYKTLLAKPEDDRPASPINYLSDGAPLFHIVVGENDFDRIKRTSREMTAALQDRRQRVTFAEWTACDHFDTHLALSQPEHSWYECVREAFATIGSETTSC